MQRELHDLGDPAGIEERRAERDRKRVEDLHVSQARKCMQIALAHEKDVNDEVVAMRLQAQNVVEELEARRWAWTQEPAPWTRSNEHNSTASRRKQEWAPGQW